MKAIVELWKSSIKFALNFWKKFNQIAQAYPKLEAFPKLADSSNNFFSLRLKKLSVIFIMLFVFCSVSLSAEIRNVQVLWDAALEPLNIGDLIHFKVTTDGPGSVIVDISTVHQSIQLYDDGTNGDGVPGDHVYELDYMIFEGDTVAEGPILVYFIADDGTQTRTKPTDTITPKITIDGTRPIITNDGVSPDPFNPYMQFAYIRYILTENASVFISIYGGNNQMVRKLGIPSGRPGENHATWNGADDRGAIMPDGIYTYKITAKDMAGNDAVPTRGGCILSTVYIEIDNSLIAPNPFSPDGDEVDDITWITFEVKLFATEEQLAILGFGGENLVTASIEDDRLIQPYALIGISVFNSSGMSNKVFSHDLTGDADTDYAPNGWPNGKMPPDVPPGSGNFMGVPNGFVDFPDEKKGNDWDTLVPLNGPFEEGNKNCYMSAFSVGWDAKGTSDGTYLINIECELVGRTWEFADYMKSEGGIILGEKWHAVPARHHGILAFPRRKSVIIDRREMISVDDDPPIVTSTEPSSGSTIDPAREQIKEITVHLDDGASGSGVDPVESVVSLLDPLGNKLGGQHLPYGINTVKLVLDSELTISGEYKIEVLPVDKRGNKAPEPSVFKFTIKDTSAPTVVPNTVQPKPTELDGQEKPIQPYTEPIHEVSVVLTDGLTGSGVDMEKSTIYLRNSADETLKGDLVVDKDNRKLTYILKEPVATSGTYTIVVIATDYAGSKGIYTYQFVMNMSDNIEVRYGGKTYLVIYASTEAVAASGEASGGKGFDLSKITVTGVSSFPVILPELSYIDGSAIKVEPYNIQLSRDADLILYYEENKLPIGVAKTGFSIYAFKSQAKNWVQLPNAVLLEENNKLTAKINYIDQYYMIAYTNPVAPSPVDEVMLDPPKYFNPDKQLLNFTFARNITNYQVDIYNVSGDRIASLKEQGRPDNSLGWDGKNDDNEVVRNGVFICRISYKVDNRSKSLNKLVAVIRR